MHLHKKLLKNRRLDGITRKSKSTSKEIPENDNFVCFGSRDLFTRRGMLINDGEKSSLFILFDKVGCNLLFAKDK
jgi:hypothetical protein